MACKCARALLLTLFMAFVSLPGCRISVKMNGSALDYNIYKTISVSEFPIRAALVYPPLQQTFENALLDYISRNTRLQTTDGTGDLQLEGEITGYNLSYLRCVRKRIYHSIRTDHMCRILKPMRRNFISLFFC